MEEGIKAGYARPASGPVEEPAPRPTLEENRKKEVVRMIQVGKKRLISPRRAISKASSSILNGPDTSANGLSSVK